jgi:feruloyl esterase
MGEMMKIRATARCSRLSVVAAVVLLGANAAAACESLVGRTFGSAEIAGATSVAAGEFRLPEGSPGAAAANAAFASLPAFCRVQAVARPSADSSIRIEIWLPVAGWNGKLLAVGNGAWAGSISYGALADALADGYAAASTDTGHVGNNVDFAIGHSEKLVDFAHRAVHEMALAAKAVVAANYARPHDYAYFAGCSTGGRQALAEAQRYPADFDGIVAGAPAYYPSHIQGTQVFTAAVNANQRGTPLGEREFALVNEAVIAACDTHDGVADGVLEDPAACRFDPRSLVCKDGSAAACLSPEQAGTVASTYRGPVDAAGRSLFPGLALGSERGWRTLSGERPLGLAYDTYARLVLDDPEWDFRSFDAARDIPLAVERIGPLLDSADPNIDAFVERGGKLLLYHGWGDPGIPAAGTIRYHDEVQSALGAAAADSVRLFMVPGMGHCRGGTGTDTFDAVAALDAWVTRGAAPERIEAAKTEDGRVVRTRPLCAYPKRAVYDGSGSSDDSANFVCR